jgi:CO dehydrogenase nickel-insertion accessory protein CooC1
VPLRAKLCYREIDGTVMVSKKDNKQVVTVVPADQKITNYELKGMKAKVRSGATVTRSQVLAESENGKKTIKAGGIGTVKVDKDKIVLTHDSGNSREYTVSEYALLK